MLRSTLQTLLTRELRAVRREIEAYPDDASIWRSAPGIPNTGGTLALHVAGNIQHFFGAILGRDGYKRDRDLEFARRDVPRKELLAGIDAAIASVDRTLPRLDDAALTAPYPEPIAKRRVSTEDFAVHLASHLAYHLGQLDYHRRAVTGDPKGVDAVSVRELPEV
ncbi:MAG: DinB family protein [Gemmatimonadaceae bacterium]